MNFSRIYLLLMVCAQIGCSTFQKISNFRESTLSNMNPAPEKMSPPEDLNIVDKTHLQSKADYHFSMAESYAFEGESEKAIEAYKNALIYDDKSVTIRIQLAKEYAKVGFLSECLEQSEIATELDPTNLDARLMLASSYSTLKMYDLALSQYFTAMDLDPDGIEAPLYIGAIYAEQGKFQEAANHFQSLAERKKGSPKEHLFYYYLGRVRVEQGEAFDALAEKAFIKSISLNPEYESATISLAKLYVIQKKEAQAVELMQSYQERFTPSRDMARMLTELYIERDQFNKAYEQLEIVEGYDSQDLNTKFRLAMILLKLKKYDQAIERLKILAKLDLDVDKISYYLGTVYETIGDYQKAQEEYEKVRFNGPYFEESAHRIVSIISRSRDEVKTLGYLQKIIDKGPSGPSLYVFYATILNKLKKNQQAIPVLEQAVAKFPDQENAWFLLGSILEEVGDRERSIEIMRKIIVNNENHVQAINFLAYTYAIMGQNLDEAEQLANRATLLKPKDAYILDTLGWVLFKQGRVAEAIKHLEEAYSLNDKESIIAEHLGDAYYRHQLVNKARDMYLQAFKSEADESKQNEIKTKLTAIENQIETYKRMPASLGKEK